MRSKWSSILSVFALVTGGFFAERAEGAPICATSPTHRIQCATHSGPGQFNLVCDGLSFQCPGKPPIVLYEMCRLPRASDEFEVISACNSESAMDDGGGPTRPPYAETIDTTTLPMAPGRNDGAVFPYRFPFEEAVEKLAHRHGNGGGIVSEDSRVDPSAYIGPGAVVSSSQIGAGAVIFGGAVVSSASVPELSTVSGATLLYKTSQTLQCSAETLATQDVKLWEPNQSLSIAAACLQR